MAQEGKLIIFSAPSGSGKTTIVKEILKSELPVEFSISACNRQPRTGEQDGKDYFFLSTDEFLERIEKNELVEWEEVYPGRYYGTLRSELDRIWKSGKHVLFDVDVVGGLALKKQFGEQALAMFIQPPSVEELKRRLQGRATDSQDEIAKRVAKAEEELSYAPRFDVIITNDELDKAVQETFEKLTGFIA